MSDAPSYFSLQQVVEEVDDEWLRDFLSEDALETDVGEGFFLIFAEEKVTF